MAKAYKAATDYTLEISSATKSSFRSVNTESRRTNDLTWLTPPGTSVSM